MIKRRPFLCLILMVFIFSPLLAGERTIPVDIFLMIDKSQSMAEPGKFESMHQWIREQLIGQILINGDWITIYQFYGTQQNMLTLTVQDENDRKKIVEMIDSITPDGQYTDIGLALDTIKLALDKRGTNDRLKIMLLLTDLKQEAPWTSRYAGSPESFESPYLAEARILPHDAWYEITLDMDIQNMVVKTSKELFSSIQLTQGQTANLSVQDASITDLQEGSETIQNGITSTDGQNPQNNAQKAPLPIILICVIVSAVAFSGAIIVLGLYLKRKKEREQENKKEKLV